MSIYNKTVGGLTYYTNAKRGASFTTKTDESGNTYLLFTEGVADPQFNKDGALHKFLGAETAFTFKIDLARNGADNVMAFDMMLRVSGANRFSVLTSDESGAVYLGAKGRGFKIGDITEQFTTFTIQMDFASGELCALDSDGGILITEDGRECKITVSVPSASDAQNMLEWLKTLDNYNFVWYASSASNASLRIDNVTLYGSLLSHIYEKA